MNNIITKSILYILFSFLFLSLTIFLFNEYYNFYIYSLSLKYTLYELLGLVVFFSQILFVIRENNFSARNIIFNTIICWFLYITAKYLLIDKNLVYFFNNIPGYIYITRDHMLTTNFDIMSFDLVTKFIKDIHEWDLSYLIPQSSFILLLLNISLNSYLKHKFNEQILFHFFIITLLFLFYLYIWDVSYNTPLFLLSIILIKGTGIKNEIH